MLIFAYVSIYLVNIYCWTILSIKSWEGEDCNLEPADKICSSGTFCWHKGYLRFAKKKCKKEALSEIGHTLCFGFGSLHLFAITLHSWSRKKLFWSMSSFSVLLVKHLDSPYTLLHSSVSSAAVAKAEWWGHYCGKDSNIFQNKSKQFRRIKCPCTFAYVEICACGVMRRCTFTELKDLNIKEKEDCITSSAFRVNGLFGTTLFIFPMQHAYQLLTFHV